MFSPVHPDVLPETDVERAQYRRCYLPKLPALVERNLRATRKDVNGLTDEQVDVLLSFFALREITRVRSRSQRGDPEKLFPFERDVLAIEVQFYPKGRAVLRPRSGDYEVEILWTGVRPRKLSGVSRVTITTEQKTLPSPLPDLSVFMAAFWVRIRTASARKMRAFTSVLANRPHAGKAPDLAWYRSLLAEYDRLVVKGVDAPAKEIAERMGENHATVRSWISRAREYAERGK